jgi:hypothetical protein
MFFLGRKNTQVVPSYLLNFLHFLLDFWHSWVDFMTQSWLLSLKWSDDGGKKKERHLFYDSRLILRYFCPRYWTPGDIPPHPATLPPPHHQAPSSHHLRIRGLPNGIILLMILTESNNSIESLWWEKIFDLTLMWLKNARNHWFCLDLHCSWTTNCHQRYVMDFG